MFKENPTPTPTWGSVSSVVFLFIYFEIYENNIFLFFKNYL